MRPSYYIIEFIHYSIKVLVYDLNQSRVKYPSKSFLENPLFWNSNSLINLYLGCQDKGKHSVQNPVWFRHLFTTMHRDRKQTQDKGEASFIAPKDFQRIIRPQLCCLNNKYHTPLFLQSKQHIQTGGSNNYIELQVPCKNKFKAWLSGMKLLP